MLVILKENVENLGQIGDLVTVSPGFARNFLLPRKLVIAADAGNVKMIENQKKLLEKKRQASRAGLQEIAQKLADFKITLHKKVGDNDKLFGSVTTNDVSDALKTARFTVEKRMIHIERPIKSLGVHTVEVRLDSGIEASVQVWVVKEQG